MTNKRNDIFFNDGKIDLLEECSNYLNDDSTRLVAIHAMVEIKILHVLQDLKEILRSKKGYE